MLKILLPLLLIGCTYRVAAQDTTFTAEERALLDSMFQNDAFLAMLGSPKISYAEINAGVSNGIFSLKNNSLNAAQAETNKLYYTVSGAYYHKSGLALSVNGSIANDGGRFKTYQYGITPSYYYMNKKLVAGISYTRFIEGASTGFNINPYQNDFYGNLVLKKPWFTPGIALGYATGIVKEYFDSTFLLVPQPPLQPRNVRITDTITTRVKNFSFTWSVSHTWNYYHVFTKGDGIELQPSLLLNAGSSTMNISHSNSLNSRRPFVQKIFKNAFGNGKNAAPFQIQSAALLISAGYDIGHFNLSPQLYVDYYFPETSGDRFSVIASFAVSYAF